MILTVGVTAKQDEPTSHSNLTWRGSSFVMQVAVLTGRALRTSLRDPKMQFFGLLQPLVMLLLFSQVFGGVTKLDSLTQWGPYINYLLPATLVTAAMNSAMSVGAGFIFELSNGVIARFRSMPISLFAVLLAQSLSESIRLGIQLVVMLLAAVVLLGYTPAGGMLGIAAALAVALVVGWGICWLYLAFATWVKKIDTMQAITFLTMFPLMFASSAYMPISTMPTWAQVIATINPFSYAIFLSRGLATTHWEVNPATTLISSLTIICAIALLCSYIAARNFRKTS